MAVHGVKLRERLERIIGACVRAEVGRERRSLLLKAVRAGASRARLCGELGVSRQALSKTLQRARAEEVETG